MSETASIKEVVPYVGICVVAFFVAGFVTFALFNGLTNTVSPTVGQARWNYEGMVGLVAGWLAVFVIIGAAIGFYIGRK